MRRSAGLILVMSCMLLVLPACKTLDASKEKVMDISKSLNASQPARNRPFLIPRGEFADFMVVTAQQGDTFSSLAATHYDDPDKGWLLEDINDTEKVLPGMDVIIPLPPFPKGGIDKDGYQVVPILVYHNFSKTKTDKMTVTEANFREQMQFLKDNGYKALTLDEFYDFLEFKLELPKKSVVLTFDDGWCAFYKIAYPILKSLELPATLFVYDEIIHSKQCLSWDQIKEMSQNGIAMQNHTKGHRDLTKILESESAADYLRNIEEQLVSTHDTLKNMVGYEPRYLAYPYGKTNELFEALLNKNNYRLGFTVERGSAPFFVNNYHVNRSMIYGDFGLKEFQKNLQTKEKIK